MPEKQQLSRGLTIREFAESQGLSPSGVRNSIARGTIPSYKIGGSRRIPAAYLEELQRPALALIEERARWREAGRRAAEASLPDVSPESYRRVAEVIREPINRYVRTAGRGGDADAASAEVTA